MGLWSFMKDTGKSLFGGDEPSAEKVQQEVNDLGLDAEGLDITVEGDVVKVSGAAASQEAKEKIIMAVGNLEGIAAVEDNAGGADPVFHEVQPGDTLWAIAEKTLGNGAHYEKVFEANRPMVSHPDKIYPGQNLRIPQEGTMA